MEEPDKENPTTHNENDQQKETETQTELPTSVTASAKPEETDDPMLGFLTLLAKVERPACANCDSKDLAPMFFCNTCGQAMCSSCKQETHRAKMFTHHDVSSISPYSREPQRKCPVHSELYIMFSPATETLLCINCFRDLSPNVRSQCMDLDTAYTQRCDGLQRGMKAVAELDVKIREEAVDYRNHLKNLHINAMREESTIHVFSKILRGTVTQTEEKLIDCVKRELQVKERALEEKLHTLESLQSNVQAYLTLSTAFISSASKFELLKLAGGLVERLAAIGAVVQPAKISPESSHITSNFKTEFAQSLKALLQDETWAHNIDNIALPSENKEEREEFSGGNGKDIATKDPIVNPENKVPFLGRSQSLPNMILTLESAKSETIAVTRTETVRPTSLEVNNTKPMSIKTHPRRATQRTSRNDTTRYQSFPKESKRNKKSSCPGIPSPRSRSVDATKTKSPHYDVSQLELFATIQSRKAVSRGEKNVLVTSLVGVRKSDRGDEKKKNEPERPGTVPTTKNSAQSGHVCVVQAMVHHDAGSITPSNTRSFSSDSFRKKRRQTSQHQWDHVYQPLGGTRKQGVVENDRESSIELTPEQFNELIKAMTAAQRCRRAEDKIPGSLVVKELQSNRDKRYPTLKRNDSFEGHEDAVRMLVDAVRELRQLCCSKGSCDHI